MVMYGFSSGAAINLTPASVGEVCRVENYGKRAGTAFIIANIGALVGVHIGGAII